MITSTECETGEARPNSSPLLQAVLGTDKRNPIFSVCRRTGSPPSLHVYYGAELLEVMPEDRQHPTFKLLVGRLYNARVKAVALQRSFGVDRNTMQRWGQALQSGDAQQLMRALAGRGGQRKLTPEIQSFVRRRFPEIYQQSRAGYSQRVREEIQRVFGVQLSGECLRPLLKSLRAELRHEVNEPATPRGTENRETACECVLDPSTPCPGPLPPEPLAVAPAAGPLPDIRKESPVLPEPSPACAVGFCHPLGVLLFSAVLLPRFRQALGLPADAVVTCVLDRGIFSQDVFAKAVEAPDYHLITWEKNFQPGPWDPQKCSGQYALERTRNHAQDKRVYRFEYLDQDWTKNPKMRQLIVRATNPQGNTIQVGILTDHRQRAAAQILYLMFNRRTQENDFKYLDEHFGINQITSYASVAYERLKDQVEQQQIRSGAYKATEEKIAQLKSQLSKLLFSQHQHPRKSARRTERITALTSDLAQARQDQAKTQKEVSRLEVLSEQQMVRLDTRNKRLLDSLKLIARNAFYQALAPFKTAYDNYREDHERFRNLTQADGVLAEAADQVDAYLLPTVNYRPAIEKIVCELLTEINGQDPRMPDGSGRRLRLHLGKKTGLQVAIVS